MSVQVLCEPQKRFQRQLLQNEDVPATKNCLKVKPLPVKVSRRFNEFHVCFCLRIENRAHKTYIFANGTSWVMLGWGGVGVLTFCLVCTVNVATLPRSLECLLHCYAAEISSAMECFLRYMLLRFATLPRSLECFLRYMLLRCQDLWNAFYVTCCYAAEISGMLSTLLVATLPRSLECFLRYLLLRCRDLWNAFYVTCCYAAKISGMLSTLLVAALPRSLECFLRYMLLRCRMLCYKKLLQKTADVLQKLE